MNLLQEFRTQEKTRSQGSSGSFKLFGRSNRAHCGTGERVEGSALPVSAGKPVHFSLLDEDTAERRPVFALSLILCSSDLQYPVSSFFVFMC